MQIGMSMIGATILKFQPFSVIGTRFFFCRNLGSTPVPRNRDTLLFLQKPRFDPGFLGRAGDLDVVEPDHVAITHAAVGRTEADAGAGAERVRV